jgi:hypothetical protein
MREELRISGSVERSFKDKLRYLGVMPLIAGILGYLAAGGPFFNRASRIYGLERLLFEALLSLRLAYTVEVSDSRQKP